MADEEFFDEEDNNSKEGIYSDEGREEMLENDEIDAFEEGFMKGAEMDGQNAKCRKCGRILMDRDKMVEKEVDDGIIWFCSEKCADKFEDEHS
ncbi:MAG: hypothetical protein ABIG89_00780 [Candidatus Woesearchaeota archaeon]